MQSSEYKSNIRNMIRNTLNRKFPGLKPSQVTAVANEVAIAVHARFYGANIDGVESPIWRDDPNRGEWYKDKQPTKTALELME